MLIVGAMGTGKTSACVYPYVEQLVGYRADDPTRKIGGLFLEVKGDPCRHVRDLLARQARADNYVEASLASPYRTARCTTSSMRTRWSAASRR